MGDKLETRLRQLQSLHEQGLITSAEYQEQKAALLSNALGTSHLLPSVSQLGGQTTVTAGGQGTATGPLAGATTVDSGAGFPALVGSYKVLGIIGAGGMGTVLRARHVEEGWARGQGGDVALKLIHPDFARDPSFRERFLNEAQIGKRVQHASLAPVHEVVSAGPWLGTVMELVDGKSLSDTIPSGGMSVDEALLILRPLSGALDFLHAQGVVHRDLKPANIKLRSDSTPVILDLGIAKDLRAEDGLTRTMTTMGTTAWMAPEQMDAKNVGAAADRYALGLITYHLLSGRMPWDSGLSDTRLGMVKLMGQHVPLSDVKPEIPRAVSRIVMRMLSLAEADRFGSCMAFMDDLVGARDRQKREQRESAEVRQREEQARKAAEGQRLFDDEVKRRTENEVRQQAERQQQRERDARQKAEVEAAERRVLEEEERRKRVEDEARRQSRELLVQQAAKTRLRWALAIGVIGVFVVVFLVLGATGSGIAIWIGAKTMASDATLGVGSSASQPASSTPSLGLITTSSSASQADQNAAQLSASATPLQVTAPVPQTTGATGTTQANASVEGETSNAIDSSQKRSPEDESSTPSDGVGEGGIVRITPEFPLKRGKEDGSTTPKKVKGTVPLKGTRGGSK